MPIVDPFKEYSPAPTSPISGGFNVVPNDSVDLPILTRALYVGGAGDVSVAFDDGTILTLPNLAAGVIYPIRAARVMAAGTTATAIKGLY
ncbi:MAG: hypothetical protein HRU30_13330 [Rhodobacteraceae bacterium]|nr:hypothetical protein [Paracoccaceae bacterium]